jgi:hypothetical protein
MSGAEAERNTLIANTSGEVEPGDAALFYIGVLKPDETLVINQAYLTNADGTPAPDGIDLVIGTVDTAAGTGSKEETILSGDGSTVYDDVQDVAGGDGISTYGNSSGNTQTVGVFIDNGQFNTGTGVTETIAAGVIGEEGSNIELEPPVVKTLDISDVGPYSAVANGELVDIDGHNKVRLLLEYKEPDDTVFVVDEEQPLVGEEQVYTATFENLQSEQTYDWRAGIAYSDLEIVDGQTKQFTTKPPIVDDFERNTPEFYDGDVGFIQITQSYAANGSRSLEYTLDNNGAEVRSTSGLDYYPSVGDTIEWYVNIESLYANSDTYNSLDFRFGTVGTANDEYVGLSHGYESESDVTPNPTELVIFETGGNSDRITGFPDASTGDEFKYTLEWDTDTISATIEDLTNNNTYNLSFSSVVSIDTNGWELTGSISSSVATSRFNIDYINIIG